MEKTELMPIIDYTVEKALRQIGKDSPEEIRLVKEAVSNDPEINAKIAALGKTGLKSPPIDPDKFPRFRAFVRPLITILLSATFVFLIVSPFFKGSIIGDVGKDWDKIFSAFMGVFGTIIGFWFGERSALKVPGAEPTPITKPSPSPGAPAGPQAGTGAGAQPHKTDQ